MATKKFITVNWQRPKKVVCLVRGHEWDQFYAIHPLMDNSFFCKRCQEVRPSWKRVKSVDGAFWNQALNPDGTNRGEASWMGGP